MYPVRTASKTEHATRAATPVVGGITKHASVAQLDQAIDAAQQLAQLAKTIKAQSERERKWQRYLDDLLL